MTASEIDRILEREASVEVSPPLQALADAARSRHGGVKAVLFYGSCLRDGVTEDRVADLYLLVANYRQAHSNRLSALANAMLPPNVYYLEAECDGRLYRAKYAVVSLEQLRRRVAPRALHPYFWARFCQPTAIAWHDGEETRKACLEIFRQAQVTMLAAALPTVIAETPEQLWLHALKQTYCTELRAEEPGRASVLLAHDRERYDAIGKAFLAEWEDRRRPPAWLARGLWGLRRFVGKPLSLLRLMKAAFTFAGGAGYLAWKLERHSGVRVPLTEWQKRHPILAGVPLAIKLYRKGAFR